MMTEERRRHLSAKLKQAHAEGRHIGWNHVNANMQYVSYPERFFREVFENAGLFEIYDIKTRYRYGKYNLDFAFVDLKLDVEIDGIQHVRTPDAIEHDKVRTEWLESRGWVVYRILWIEAIRDTKNVIERFFDFLKSEKMESRSYDLCGVAYAKKYIPKYGNRTDYANAKKNEWDAQQALKIPLIENSNIDFSKFGWVNKVALLLNIPPQKVHRWMLRMMPDFYNSKCFIRNKCKEWTKVSENHMNEILMLPTKKQQVTALRKYGYSLAVIGKALGIHPTNVCRYLK